MRRTPLVLTVVALVGLLSACGNGTDSAGTPGPASASSPSDAATPDSDASEDATSGTGTAAPATTAATPKPAGTTTKPTAAALTCKQLRNANLGSPTVKYNGYPEYIPLADGRWAGEDGATVELQAPCGIGDLNGDGAADAVGSVMLTAGGTGRFWTVVVWRNVSGAPQYLTLDDLGDRTPVAAISVAGQKATVVYYTRTDGSGMAVLNIKRTAVYQLSGTAFTELSHTDVPYTP